MADCRQEKDDLLKHEGFEKKAPELSKEDHKGIQECLDNIGKPAFENICDQLNSFQNVKGEVTPSKKLPNSIIESFELTVFKISQPKLTYRLHFAKREKSIYIAGESSTPNIYGENTRFQPSSLERPLPGTTEDDLAADFFSILKSKF